MQTDIFMGMEVFSGILLPSILGVAAAVARSAKYGWRGLAHFIADGAICVFVSVIVFWGLDAYPALAPTVKCAISSISAFMCNELLDWLKNRARSEIMNRFGGEAKGQNGGK